MLLQLFIENHRTLLSVKVHGEEHGRTRKGRNPRSNREGNQELTRDGGEASVGEGCGARGSSVWRSAPCNGDGVLREELAAVVVLSTQARRRWGEEVVCEGVGLARRYPYLWAEIVATACGSSAPTIRATVAEKTGNRSPRRGARCGTVTSGAENPEAQEIVREWVRKVLECVH